MYSYFDLRHFHDWMNIEHNEIRNLCKIKILSYKGINSTY